MMITPKTFQPLPRTSPRLRPKDSPADFPSRTIAGTIRHQIVSRKSPGAMSRTSPIAIAMPAISPAGMIEVSHAGPAGTSVVEQISAAARTSRTASTIAPWSQKMPTMLTSAPRRTPTQPNSHAARA